MTFYNLTVDVCEFENLRFNLQFNVVSEFETLQFKSVDVCEFENFLFNRVYVPSLKICKLTVWIMFVTLKTYILNSVDIS